MNIIDPGMRGATALSGGRLAAAAVLGAGVGLLVAFDGAIAHTFDWLWFAQQMPYALSSIVLAAALAAALVVRSRNRLWREQFALATMGIVYSIHMPAVDVGPINPLNIMIVVVCALWLLHRFVDHTAPWSPSGFFHLTVLFMACALASAFNHAPFEILRGWLALLPKLVLVLVLVDVLDDRRNVDLAIRTLIASSAIFGLVGMAQSILYLGYQLDVTLMELDAPRFLTVAGMPMLRAAGLQHTPHGYAQSLAVAAVVALFLAGAARGRRRAWLVGTAFAASVGVAASIARGQWFALFVGIGLLPLIARPRLSFALWVPLGSGLLLVAFASGLLPWVLRAFESFTDASAVARLELLGEGVRALRDHPFKGVGINNFPSYFPMFDRNPVHNSPVQVASELGIFACLIFVTAFAWVAARLANAIRAAADAHARHQLKALLAGHLCLMLAIQFDPLAYSDFVWFYLVLASSAVRVALREARGEATMTFEQESGSQRLGSLRSET